MRLSALVSFWLYISFVHIEARLLNPLSKKIAKIISTSLNRRANRNVNILSKSLTSY